MKTLLLIFFIGFTIFLSSCSSNVRLKKDVFEKVEIGMTVKQVKDLLGEPAIIRSESIDSSIHYFYYIHNNLFKKDYAVVEFTKEGMVFFKFYGNPD